MKQFLFTLGAVSLFSFNTEAAILRVNNIAGVSVNYTNISAAVAAAGNGDTIYLEPSATSYGSASISKKVTIIGNGYFMNTGFYTYNTGLQADMQNSTVGDLTFLAGSEFSTVMGCHIASNVYCRISNLNIKRNYIAGAVYLGNYQNSVYVNLSNIDIRQNVIAGGISTNQSSTNGGTVGITNVNIQNNILTTYFYMYLNLPVGVSGFMMNNIIWTPYYNVETYNFQVNNNVMVGGNYSANNNVFFNNASTNTTFGNQNGNQQNISATSMFLNYNTGGADTSFMVNPSGPGAGAGFGGVDLGPYGGPDPYRKSGIPPVPTIYQLSAPATTTTTTLPVTISTRSND